MSSMQFLRPNQPPGSSASAGGLASTETSATVDQPGHDCLFAKDLMDFAQQFVEGTAANPEDPTLAHVQNCLYCRPRYEALVSLHRLEPGPVELHPPFTPLPPLDHWSGDLVAAHALAAEAGGQSIVAATLEPKDGGCQLANRSLSLELRWEPFQEGKIRCQLVVPIAGRGALAGTPGDVLERLHNQQYMVEFTSEKDPYGAWGFDTVLQWDNRKTALVSPRRVLPLRGFHGFDKMELTHLQPVVGYDLK
jgi:hypothetical protein